MDDTDKKRVYYYSGTGNCLWSAKRIAERLDAPPPIAITAELVNEKPLIEGCVCVLVFPSYAYGLPALVRRFLKNAVICVDYYAAVSTCGSHTGGSFTSIKRFLKKKGQALHFAAEIQTVENYVHMFGFTKEPKLSARLKGQVVKTDEVAAQLAAFAQSRVQSCRPFSAFVNALFRFASHFFPLFYRVKKTCNGCGFCHKVCPCAAITMTEKNGRRRPKFRASKCDHCQACMELCPKKSIKYMRITPKSPRYRHPEIEINELIKR